MIMPTKYVALALISEVMTERFFGNLLTALNIIDCTVVVETGHVACTGYVSNFLIIREFSYVPLHNMGRRYTVVRIWRRLGTLP